jgi:hypothetical protein
MKAPLSSVVVLLPSITATVTPTAAAPFAVTVPVSSHGDSNPLSVHAPTALHASSWKQLSPWSPQAVPAVAWRGLQVPSALQLSGCEHSLMSLLPHGVSSGWLLLAHTPAPLQLSGRSQLASVATGLPHGAPGADATAAGQVVLLPLHSRGSKHTAGEPPHCVPAGLGWALAQVPLPLQRGASAHSPGATPQLTSGPA